MVDVVAALSIGRVYAAGVVERCTLSGNAGFAHEAQKHVDYITQAISEYELANPPASVDNPGL